MAVVQNAALDVAIPSGAGPETRRAEVRYSCLRRCLVRHMAGEDNARRPAEIRDISLDGLGVELDFSAHCGTSLAVEVETRYGVRVLLAEVVYVRALWARAWHAGCRLATRLTED